MATYLPNLQYLRSINVVGLGMRKQVKSKTLEVV